MKTVYPRYALYVRAKSLFKIVSFFIGFIVASFHFSASAQELVFNNYVLESGNEGQDGTIYRFKNVTDGIDALLKINGRSDELVTLHQLDMEGIGHAKAFQPQVSYNGGTTPDGNASWWMEFQINFVQTNTTIAATVNSFSISAIDIDGNNDKINESVSFYHLTNFIFEHNTVLITKDIHDATHSGTIIGKEFTGPTTNYADIDTNATTVMVTLKYQTTNSFTFRAGGSSTGISSASERMYSFWFKGFEYVSPFQATLPIKLSSFSATAKADQALLNWATDYERNSSHFVVERSFDGREFEDLAMLFTEGNHTTRQQYQFTDKSGINNKGLVYYRLRMVDQDGKYKHSPAKAVNFNVVINSLQVNVFPNPVMSELKISVPAGWQKATVSFELINMNGQVVKQTSTSQASQVELMNMSEVKTGTYILRARNGSHSISQKIIKL